MIIYCIDVIKIVKTRIGWLNIDINGHQKTVKIALKQQKNSAKYVFTSLCTEIRRGPDLNTP